MQKAYNPFGRRGGGIENPSATAENQPSAREERFIPRAFGNLYEVPSGQVCGWEIGKPGVIEKKPGKIS